MTLEILELGLQIHNALNASIIQLTDIMLIQAFVILIAQPHIMEIMSLVNVQDVMNIEQSVMVQNQLNELLEMRLTFISQLLPILAYI